MRGRRRELGRIEDNEIEAGSPVAQLAQLGEGVRFAPLRAVGGQRWIAREVLAGEGDAPSAELSIETTRAAPPASAASVNAPV